MSNSNRPALPKKPFPDFPLFPHRTGRWAKKIQGRFRFYGRWGEMIDGRQVRFVGDWEMGSVFTIRFAAKRWIL